MKQNIPPGTVPCHIEQLAYGPWLVIFANDPSITLFLQLDIDQAAFAVASGAVKPPPDWNGEVKHLGVAWENFDPEAIELCPEDYLSVAK